MKVKSSCRMRETIVTANRCLQNGRKSESATLQTGAKYSKFTKNFSEIYSEIKCQAKKTCQLINGLMKRTDTWL